MKIEEILINGIYLTEFNETIANERKTGLYGISPPRKLNNPSKKKIRMFLFLFEEINIFTSNIISSMNN